MFFQSGVGNLTFGVSLFNVWGNIYKLKNESTEIVLDSGCQRTLRDALDALKAKKRADISAAEDEKTRESAKADLARIEANRIHNKDYMSILSFYRIKENPNDLTGFTEGVVHMSSITKKLNQEYGSQVRENRAKATADAAAPAKVAAVPAPIPVVPSVKALPALIPSVGGRAASPSLVNKRR
jgi:hypothetical protein